jgi:hypothetical protein
MRVIFAIIFLRPCMATNSGKHPQWVVALTTSGVCMPSNYNTTVDGSTCSPIFQHSACCEGFTSHVGCNIGPHNMEPRTSAWHTKRCDALEQQRGWQQMHLSIGGEAIELEKVDSQLCEITMVELNVEAGARVHRGQAGTIGSLGQG